MPAHNRPPMYVSSAIKKNCKRHTKIFLAHNIDDIVISEHIPGDLVKFYGVEGTDFFFYHYPTATGTFSKFGLEVFNGVPAGYDFSPEELKQQTAQPV